MVSLYSWNVGHMQFEAEGDLLVIAVNVNSLSFTSPVTNLTYPIHTYATCSSSNLIYLLTCTQCDSFYVGETGKVCPLE